MSIIESLKRLIFGASAEPVGQIPGPAPQYQPQQFLQTSSQQTPQTWPNGDARTLLKEATALKRAKRYDEAVAMLRRAYQTPTICPMMVVELLRLPMYLQLAGRADEGWGEMNRLNITYVDGISQARIAAQMATFLRKEGKYKNAALFAVWTLFKQKEVNVDTRASMVQMADQKPASDAEWKALGLPPIPWGEKTGTTPSGNPIYDVGYPGVHRCLTDDFGPAAIRATLARDLAKIVPKKIISAMVTDLSHYLAKPPPYDIESVNLIFGKHLAYNRDADRVEDVIR
jgi:hypothetical protein